jgi:hypothetical protein
MSEIQEITQVQVMDNTALQLITRAEIDSQIATAKAFPRSLKQSMDRALSMATVNEEVAASCTYAVPRSGKTIEGASVRLAEIVCSTFGNLRAGARVISNDGKTVTAQGICHDLESNYSVTVEVKKKITDKFGKTFSEDMQVVTGNAACAIAYRNAVYKVIPAAIIDDIWEKTKEVARGKAETLVKRRDKAIEYFHSQGIKDDQICRVLEIKKIEDIDLDKLQTLRGILTSVKNGEATLKDLFEAETNQPDPAELKKQTIIELIKTAESEKEVDKHVKQLPTDKDVLAAALDRKTELEKDVKN